MVVWVFDKAPKKGVSVHLETMSGSLAQRTTMVYFVCKSFDLFGPFWPGCAEVRKCSSQGRPLPDAVIDAWHQIPSPFKVNAFLAAPFQSHLRNYVSQR